MHFNNLCDICDDVIEKNTFKPYIHFVSVLTVYFRVFEAFKSRKERVYFCVSQSDVFILFLLCCYGDFRGHYCSKSIGEQQFCVIITACLSPRFTVKCVDFSPCSDGFLEKLFLLHFFFIARIM